MRRPRPSPTLGAPSPHLEEPCLHVHSAVAFSVAEVKRASETGAIWPHVGAEAMAVVPVKLPVVGLWTKSSVTGMSEKLPLTTQTLTGPLPAEPPCLASMNGDHWGYKLLGCLATGSPSSLVAIMTELGHPNHAQGVPGSQSPQWPRSLLPGSGEGVEEVSELPRHPESGRERP